MWYKLSKILTFIFCTGISHHVKVESPLNNFWINTIEQEQLPMNTTGLAIVLSELYSYDPEGYTGFCKAIQYFIEHGCDITEPFDLSKYLITMYGSLNATKSQMILESIMPTKNPSITTIPSEISFNEITLLEMFLANGTLVKALFVNGFQMKNAYAILSLACNRYKLALTSIKHHELSGCEYCIEQSLKSFRSSIQEIFNACDIQTQEKFLNEINLIFA